MTNLEIAYFTLLIVIFDAPERLLFGKIYFKSKKNGKTARNELNYVLQVSLTLFI